MTNLDTKPVQRETRELDLTRGGRRPLVVRLERGGKVLKIRPKGTRTWFPVTWGDVFRLALRAYAIERKAARS